MKKIVTIILLMASVVALKAQYVRPEGENSTSQQQTTQPQQQSDFWSHVSVGGNFGLQFGNITFVALSPLINYHFNDYLMIGVGPIYQYFSYNDPTYNYSYSSSIYGGRIAALCFFTRGAFSFILTGGI